MKAIAPLDCRGRSPAETLTLVRQRDPGASVVPCVGGPRHGEGLIGSPESWLLYVVAPRDGGSGVFIVRKNEGLEWRGRPCVPVAGGEEIAIIGWYEYKPADLLAPTPRLEWHPGVRLS